MQVNNFRKSSPPQLTQSIAPIHQLPSELLFLILSSLPIWKVAQCSLVCRFWNVITKNELLYQKYNAALSNFIDRIMQTYYCCERFIIAENPGLLALNHIWKVIPPLRTALESRPVSGRNSSGW